VAKQSQMRALLTIGKMGKRFQENESPWHYRMTVGACWNRTEGFSKRLRVRLCAVLLHDCNRPHSGPLPERSSSFLDRLIVAAFARTRVGHVIPPAFWRTRLRATRLHKAGRSPEGEGLGDHSLAKRWNASAIFADAASPV
jgi:hypothetical protein